MFTAAQAESARKVLTCFYPEPVVYTDEAPDGAEQSWLVLIDRDDERHQVESWDKVAELVDAIFNQPDPMTEFHAHLDQARAIFEEKSGHGSSFPWDKTAAGQLLLGLEKLYPRPRK